MGICDIPDGQTIAIRTGFYRCTVCGSMTFDVLYTATATGEVKIREGVPHRRFTFVTYPVCECSEDVWLSDAHFFVCIVSY